MDLLALDYRWNIIYKEMKTESQGCTRRNPREGFLGSYLYLDMYTYQSATGKNKGKLRAIDRSPQSLTNSKQSQISPPTTNISQTFAICFYEP
jgi:hypothetical protein